MGRAKFYPDWFCCGELTCAQTMGRDGGRERRDTGRETGRDRQTETDKQRDRAFSDTEQESIGGRRGGDLAAVTAKVKGLGIKKS